MMVLFWFAFGFDFFWGGESGTGDGVPFSFVFSKVSLSSSYKWSCVVHKRPVKVIWPKDEQRFDKCSCMGMSVQQLTQTGTFTLPRTRCSFTNCYFQQYSSHYHSTSNSTPGNSWIWCLMQSSLLKNLITSYSFSKRKRIKFEFLTAVSCILTDWTLLKLLLQKKGCSVKYVDVLTQQRANSQEEAITR